MTKDNISPGSPEPDDHYPTITKVVFITVLAAVCWVGFYVGLKISVWVVTRATEYLTTIRLFSF